MSLCNGGRFIVPHSSTSGGADFLRSLIWLKLKTINKNTPRCLISHCVVHNKAALVINVQLINPKYDKN